MPAGTSLFHQARWALAEGARRLARAGKPRVWLPDYICVEAEEGLRAHGIAVAYYRLGGDLRPDMGSLEDAAEGDVLVYVHHFGFSPWIDEVAERARSAGLALLEDAAHCLPACGTAGRHGLGVVFSPRKVLPLGGGGLLELREGVEGAVPVALASDWADVLRLGALAGRKALVLSRLPYRQVKERMGGGRPRADRERSGGPGADARAIGPLSRRILGGLRLSELHAMGRARRSNYLALAAVAACADGVQPLFGELPESVIPFALPLRSARRDAWIRAFRRAGVAVGGWPTLPDAVRLGPGHDAARALAAEVLLVPVHQDLTGRDLTLLGSVLTEGLG